MMRVHGSSVAGLQQANRIGDADPGQTMGIQLGLKLRDQATLDQLITSVSTPGSTEYGRYLSPAQFDNRFGPTATEIGQAAGFLAAHGLTVTAASTGSTLIDATGPAAAVEAAFDISIGRYRDGSGREFFANDSDPAIPAGLAPFVAGVQGLNNRYQRRHSAVIPHACPPTCATTPYTPTQLRQAYQLSAAPLANLTGTGQTLGLLELDDFWQGNIDGFTSSYGLPSIAPTRQIVDGGPALGTGQIEVELDIEVMHEIAPSASIQVFEAPNNTDAQLLDAYSCMVNPGANTGCPNHSTGLVSPSNSTSWGLCEPLQAGSTTTQLANIFSQAAAQGQSFFAASGDSGAIDCFPANGSNALAVDSPASDAHVTGVGGTRLLLNPDNSYNSEIAWPNSNTHPDWGSGGGQSVVWARPSWQTGPGVSTTANAPRQVPDVSLDADPVTGYSIYTCKTVPDPCTSGGGLQSVGGTSAGAPAWAAFAAAYNNYAACHGQPALGFANPKLYPLGVNPPTFTPFSDVTSGNNIRGNPPVGYSATPGYDKVTGLGTLRASDLAQDLAGPSGGLAISSLDQTRGTQGETITITGCGFQQTPTVNFGGVPSPNVTWQSPTSLSAVTPAHGPGDVAVQVVNPNGGGSAQLSVPNGFHYNRSASHQQLVVNSDGRLELTVTGSDGNVYHSWEGAPSGPFGQLYSLGAPSSGSFVSDPSTGLNSDGRVETFVVDNSGAVWHAWMYVPGGGWTPFYSVGPPVAGTVGAVGNVAMATNNDGRLEIFARGTDGAIWHTWQGTPSGGWGQWYSLGKPGGGGFVSDVTAGRNGDGRLEIAAVDGSGGVWHAWQTSPSGGWTSAFYPLSSRPVTGTPGINTNQDGRLEIFATAADDRSIIHIWQGVPSGGWGNWYSVGGAAGSDPSVSRNADGRLEVFANDLTGHLIHTWQATPGGGWVGPFSLGQPGTGAVTGVPQTGTYTDGRVQSITPDVASGQEWQILQTSAGAGWTGFSTLGGTVHVLPY